MGQAAPTASLCENGSTIIYRNKVKCPMAHQLSMPSSAVSKLLWFQASESKKMPSHTPQSQLINSQACNVLPSSGPEMRRDMHHNLQLDAGLPCNPSHPSQRCEGYE